MANGKTSNTPTSGFPLNSFLAKIQAGAMPNKEAPANVPNNKMVVSLNAGASKYSTTWFKVS